MNAKQWIRHVNAHIDPTSDLPRLDEERLDRWARLGLLVPMDGEYHETDLERTIALLMFERSVVAQTGANAGMLGGTSNGG